MFGRQDYTTKLPSTKGKLESPSGNLGEKSDKARSQAFPNRFKKDGTIMPNPLNMSKPRIMNSDTNVVGEKRPGPNTIGGVVGGLSDKGDYSGVKAGPRRRG